MEQEQIERAWQKSRGVEEYDPGYPVKASSNFADGFNAGAAYALSNQWRNFPTDKDGFGDADAIDGLTLPIVVRYRDGYVFAVNYDWGEESEWYQDILNHPDRFMYMPIPALPQERKEEE